MTTNNTVNKAVPISIANGGTGATTFNSYGVIVAPNAGTAFSSSASPGTAGQVLNSNGSSVVPSWVTPPSGIGSIKQIVSTSLTTTFTTSSTTYTDLTGLSVSITPASSSNKVIIYGTISGACDGNGAAFQLVRGSTAIGAGVAAGSRTTCTSAMMTEVAVSDTISISFSFIDSPATTSATTYKIQLLVPNNSAYINRSGTDGNSTTYKRAVSTITVMETT